ncbi:MAG: DUF697 domain-containing protein [Ardenticatenaceae bacterium]|nr:DUF697 domain-containing protein [Ardenticatenaceae bacterium]
MSELTVRQNKEQSGRSQLVDKLLDRLGQAIDETDEEAAADRAASLQAEYPDEPLEKLADRLIWSKCRETAVIGATTSAAAVIPGVGTVAGLTLGIAADLGLTFKLQAELVLEIAALYGRSLNTAEKQRVVLLVTGLSAGTTTLAHRVGKRVSRRLTARIGSKYITGALPVVGMTASASTNAVMTYVIGQRAKAYFSLGPEAMADWRLTAQAITGLNRELLASGSQALKSAGATAVSSVKKAGSAITRRKKKRIEE